MINAKTIFAVSIAERDLGLVYKNLIVPFEYSCDKLLANIINENTIANAAETTVIPLKIFTASIPSSNCLFVK